MTQNAWNTDYPNANGEILIGSGSGRALAGNITGDATISITNGANSIQIDNGVGSAGALVKISSATASASSAITFTSLSSTYIAYILFYFNVSPATDAVTMLLRTSTNNGSSYDSGVSDYGWVAWTQNDASASSGDADQSDSSITLVGIAAGSEEMGSGANETASGYLIIFNPSAAQYCHVLNQCTYIDESGAIATMTGAGIRRSAADVDAIQILMDSGNIASGDFVLYGVAAS